MRFFIFPLESIYIAVEADKVKRFISSDISFNEDQVNIPIYMIFKKTQISNSTISQHAIVLKKETSDNKTLVIITPPVERDIDIEEKDIQSLPSILSGVYSSFSGIYYSGQKIIFFLDIDKLTSLWMNRCKND